MDDKNYESYILDMFVDDKIEENKLQIETGELFKWMKILLEDYRKLKMKDLNYYQSNQDPNNNGKIEFSNLLKLASKEVDVFERKKLFKNFSINGGAKERETGCLQVLE